MVDTVQLQIAGLTDIGRMRQRNEDAIAWDEAAGLAVLADGMGGHQAGDVASHMATASMLSVLGGQTVQDEQKHRQLVSRAVRELNESVYSRAAENQELSGMGTTLLVMQAAGGHLVLAHVGDSRAYRLRDDEFVQLTHDHSLINDLIARGEITTADVDKRFRNVLTRAIGAREQVETDIQSLPMAHGDIYLLCSDGLHACVSDDDMKLVLQQNRYDLEVAAQALVDMANARGGADNISVILAAVSPAPSRKAAG